MDSEELSERCWIRLIIKTELRPASQMSSLLEEATELCNIIGQSIVTAKGNLTTNS